MKPQDVTAAHGDFATFMVLGLRGGADAEAKVKQLCGSVGALVRSMRTRLADSEASCVMGFGAEAWGRLFADRTKPKELEPFQEIKGDRYTAPSTPGDIFFHIRAKRRDVCHELATMLHQPIATAVTPIDEVHGFRYFDGRSIIGFVDGTENPEGDERKAFACIGDEDPDFVGGSYVFVQKYLHDMDKWNALPVEEQEKVIGRHKYNDVELRDEEKPANAHNVVTNITKPDGTELKIIRANMPFANSSKGEFGTYFVGYARTFSTTLLMLKNMFLGNPAGTTDRLLDFSAAKTGTLFFVPSAELLEELAE